jgi:hypothetical protein
MTAIPIGVTARNEASGIGGLLASLRVAVARASTELGCQYTLHVLLNDNEDETPRLLAGHRDLNVWNTRGGLVEAQRAMVERSGNSPFLVFSDADILISPDALLEVTRAMLEDTELEIAYAEKYPVAPSRRTPLARALYLYNLRDGYQTERHYFNGQFFAIRHWAIPRPSELCWNIASNNRFLDLAAGIRCDDIYLSRELLGRAGRRAIRCVPGGGIRYRPPETLIGMFRKYQRMRLEIERLDRYFPTSLAVHRQWGRRRLDTARLAAAPLSERCYYRIFNAALLLCKLAYLAQRFYFTHFGGRPCPTWLPVSETKERIP